VRQPDPGKGMEFSLSGLPVKGDPADNLCVRAWQLLQKDFPQLPPVQMHLHKAIPMGAGLGGGSADGAFALMLINEKFQLGLSTDQLLDYALHLGSDCPFFILNTPCIASGRGEQLTPVSLDLSPYAVLLVHPRPYQYGMGFFADNAHRQTKTCCRNHTAAHLYMEKGTGKRF
jgi:4-diphosphocytidyl-2-C-methyl-D-erythritol kinase